MTHILYAVERPTGLPDWADRIVRDVARRRRTTAADIMGASIFGHHVAARAEALALTAEAGGLSARRTAKLFRRDWSGVARLIRRHRQLTSLSRAA